MRLQNGGVGRCVLIPQMDSRSWLQVLFPTSMVKKNPTSEKINSRSLSFTTHKCFWSIYILLRAGGKERFYMHFQLYILILMCTWFQEKLKINCRCWRINISG